jgi:hypothetical protein
VAQETQGIFETYLHEVHILRPRLLLTQRTAPPTIPPDQHPQQSLSASEQPCYAIDREDQEDATELPRWEGIKLSSRAAKSAEGVNFLSAYRWAASGLRHEMHVG